MAREYLATVLLLILVALVGCTEEETPADRAACLVVEIDALYKEGRFEEAIPRARELLSLTEATGGPEHPAVAESLTGLAKLLRQTGDYAEARPLFERALKIRETALGPRHPAVAGSLSNLALLLKDTGEYTASRPLYERALKIREATLAACRREG